MVTQNAARLLTSFWGVSGYGRVLVPVNFRLNADEVGYIVEHSGATVLLVDPELDDALRDVQAKHRFVIGADTDAELLVVRHRTGAVARAQRGRDRHHQLHERYHRASQGRADHAPQRVGQRRDLRVAHRRQRPRCVPPHAPDVPLQRLGHDVRGHRDGWEAHRVAQGRRCRDPPARRAARSDADVRRARRRGRGARRSRNVGRPDPRQGSRPHRRRRRAAAHAHDRTHRVGARVGVLADLRSHRDVTVAHDEPSPSGVRRSRPDRARPASRSCGRADRWCEHPDRRRGRGAGARQRGVRGVLGPARGHRRRHRRRLVPHRRRRLRSTTTATSRSPTARKT